jgi:hypothetical protein
MGSPRDLEVLSRVILADLADLAIQIYGHGPHVQINEILKWVIKFKN